MAIIERNDLRYELLGTQSAVVNVMETLEQPVTLDAPDPVPPKPRESVATWQPECTCPDICQLDHDN